MFGPVLPRGPRRFRAKTLELVAKAELFNVSLTRLCATQNNIDVVKHKRITSKLPSLLPDGVHLSGAGLKRFYFSLRSAIVAALE